MKNTTLCAVGYTIAKLTANATIHAAMGGRYYLGIAPEKAVYPFILIQPYGDPISTSYSYGPVLSEVELSVRVVTDGRPAAVSTTADLLDTALRTPTPVIRSDGVVAACEKVRETMLTENSTGRTLTLLGGVYRVTVT